MKSLIPGLHRLVCAATLLLALTGAAQAQNHDFTNPQVRVQVTQDALIVETTSLPDHRWEKVNPNTPTAQNLTFQIPRSPQIASRTTAIPSRGPVAVAVNGVVFFGPEDRQGKLAIENHGLDSCKGHPSEMGVYHYHSTPACVGRDVPGQHSPVLGYAFDGFKIYGLQGEGGRPPADLDSCNGHTDSERGYHYHTTAGYPYVLGCYRGTPHPASLARGAGAGGGRMMGGGPGGGDARDRVRQACDADRQTYCPGMPPGPEMHECMRRNENSFTSACREALREAGPPPGGPGGGPMGRRPPPR